MQVWEERIFARATVGMNLSKGLIYRVATIGAYGPVTPDSVDTAVRPCVREALGSATKLLAEALDHYVQPFSTIEEQIRKSPLDGNSREVNKTTIENRIAFLRGRLSASIKRSQDDFSFRMQMCLGDRENLRNGFGMAFNLRVCDADQFQ